MTEDVSKPGDSRASGAPALVKLAAGPIRKGGRTKDLAKLLKPGEIAVIRHNDFDRVAAEGLVAAQVVAVINCGKSISGRYPNGGPSALLNAGIALVDVDTAVFDELQDRATAEVYPDHVEAGGNKWPATAWDSERVVEAFSAARENVGDELQAFARNTLDWIDKEGPALFEPAKVPDLQTSLKGRHALVVVRGLDYKADLQALVPYIREYQPAIIAVDGGADAVLEFGLRPNIICGDYDSLSERALNCGAELILHVHLDGRDEGREVLEEKGMEYHEFVADGISEDVAMLLAYEAGATLIVAVGTHNTMVEFLDKGRRGMSSTFVTRLRLGPVLVDAKGVSRLYEGRARRRDLAMLVGSALAAMLVVVIVSKPLHLFLEAIWLNVRDIWLSIW